MAIRKEFYCWGKKRHFQKLHSETTIYVTSAKNWKHLQSEATPSENVNAIQNSTIIALILLLLNKDASLDTYQTFGTRRHSKHKWLNLPKDYRNHFLPIRVIYATLAFHFFSSFLLKENYLTVFSNGCKIG